MENIDFPKSKTRRYISNEFVVFTIPQEIFGDRILEGSIQIYDDNFNDNVFISDDGYGNLAVKSNLFSKVQEVRELGNEIVAGDSSYECPFYSGSLWWNYWTTIWESAVDNWETYA